MKSPTDDELRQRALVLADSICRLSSSGSWLERAVYDAIAFAFVLGYRAGEQEGRDRAHH